MVCGRSWPSGGSLFDNSLAFSQTTKHVHDSQMVKCIRREEILAPKTLSIFSFGMKFSGTYNAS